MLVLTGFSGFGKTFTGAINSDWSLNGNWNPSGTPGGGSNVIIDANCIIPGSANLTVSSLTVNSTFTLNIGNNSLYVIGNIDNNGTLEIGDEGGLYQGGSIGGSGVYSVLKNGHNDDRWNYWCSPMANQSVLKLRYSNYIVYQSAEFGAPGWAVSDKWQTYHQQPMDQWWDNASRKGGNMSRGRGYIAAHAALVTFSGGASDVNDGSFDGMDINANGNFYCIGNPYISGLDLGQLQSDNSGILGHTFYLWAQNAAQASWLDGQTEDYGSYNTSTSSGVAGSGTLAGSTAPTGVVSTAQGFLAEGIGNGKVQYNNGQRTNGAAFLKKEVDLARFNLVSPEGKFSQINYTFLEDKIDESDKQYRSKRIHVGPGGIRLYSMFDGQECAIVGLNQLEGFRTFEVRVDANEAGNYKIALEEMPGLEDVHILLNDRLTGTYFPMNNKEPYTFTAKKNEVIEGRFFISFRKKGVSIDNLDMLKTYATPSEIVIDRSANVVDISFIGVYDLAGKMVFSTDNAGNSSIIKMPFDGKSGIYIVVVETAHGTKSSKIFKN